MKCALGKFPIRIRSPSKIRSWPCRIIFFALIFFSSMYFEVEDLRSEANFEDRSLDRSSRRKKEKGKQWWRWTRASRTRRSRWPRASPASSTMPSTCTALSSVLLKPNPNPNPNPKFVPNLKALSQFSLSDEGFKQFEGCAQVLGPDALRAQDLAPVPSQILRAL